MKMRKISGFTLLELMITLVIVGILVSIAYPSYINSVRKTNRVEAKTELMDAAQRLQRCYTSFGRYDHPSCEVYTSLRSAEGIKTRGADSFYRITVGNAVPTATSYTLTATAIKAPQLADTDCKEMTLSNTGVKTPAPPKKCWD